MKTIGLTGGIGSGKSAVSNFLAELGAIIIDADRIGHELLESNSQVQQQIFNAFNQRAFTPDGIIDRKKLGEIVFKDSKARTQLNSITHPPIFRVIQGRLEECRRQGAKVVVIEAPLLLETSWATVTDEVWVTTATKTVIIERLERRGISYKDAMARIRSQMPDSERLKLADVVIENDCDLGELKLKVEQLWQSLQFDSHN